MMDLTRQHSRADAMRGICFCLLYDLCCWLASVQRPVPNDVDEYTMAQLRSEVDPRVRLSRYVNPSVLQSWGRALQPFLASGVMLEPELGESGSFKELSPLPGGLLRAELRFGNRSSVVDSSGRRSQLPPHDWIVTVWLTPDLSGRIENAAIRRA